ncbi:MAG: hypothetical protein IPK99_11760 [Flavobacteriales bacterium]|nr:hypothetical protein [Flavobacteriales bacterium]
MTPLPLHGLVPYEGQVVPILSGRADARHGWTYTLHTRAADRELRIHYHVPHADLLKAITLYARFEEGAEVHLGKNGPMRIVQRTWNFKLGTVRYRAVRPDRNVATGWITQERMMELIRWEEALDRTPEISPLDPDHWQ